MVVKTIQQFLNNPIGDNSAVYGRRDIIIHNLENRFDKLIKTYLNKFKFYVNEIQGSYYFYIQLPSETYPEKLTYDIVIEFLPIGNAKGDLTINNYAIRLFSNNPNFIFTYAYVYNKDGLIIDFLKNKIGSKCLHEKPKIKNPHLSYGFEKSVYFALLYIKYLGLTSKSNIAGKLEKRLTKDFIRKKVKTPEEKMTELERVKESSQPRKDFKNLNKKGRILIGNSKKKSTPRRKTF